jgi:hypothetical protein
MGGNIVIGIIFSGSGFTRPGGYGKTANGIRGDTIRAGKPLECRHCWLEQSHLSGRAREFICASGPDVEC